MSREESEALEVAARIIERVDVDRLLAPELPGWIRGFAHLVRALHEEPE